MFLGASVLASILVGVVSYISTKMIDNICQKKKKELENED